MDSAEHAGISLEDLKRTAPRGFDKTLCDIIAKVQEGQRPIIVPAAAEPSSTVVERESLPPEVEQLIADMAQQLARINLEVIEAKRELSDARARISAIESIEIDKRLLKGAA